MWALRSGGNGSVNGFDFETVAAGAAAVVADVAAALAAGRGIAALKPAVVVESLDIDC